MDNAALTAKVTEIASDYGACAVGVTTVETLAGGPPTTDLEYVLPGARSAVTFALPYDQAKIEDFIAKRDRQAHQQDYSRTNTMASGIAAQIAGYIDHFGHQSVGVLSNEVYRNDEEVQHRHMRPDISHRLLAVRGGVGWFGLSGNVLTLDHGAMVSLATAVTTAELEPTAPLPAAENFCQCEEMECVSACPAAFLHEGKKDMVSVTMGGVEFSYAKRRNYNRCGFVCGGYSGLHPSGKWSTWSPGRFPIPKKDENLRDVVVDAIQAWSRQPKLEGGCLHQPLVYAATGKDVSLTCGSCMLVCAPTSEERQRRLKTLQSSGVVVQNPDGSIDVTSPEEAKQRLAEMEPKRRALYEPEAGSYDDIDVYGRSG
ncbi:MAG: epoxyqueuosine reductase [Alphaproteobacteria bacterium]|nr:epoxyqueuosine reductase [Alphaproteobacteria bacterium]